MERKIKKIILVFFALMLILTVASRAAASVIVAKVQVEQIKSGMLSYELKGEGIIKENAEKYIEINSGLKIGEVCIKEGQKVEEGDLLFSYDLEQLKDKKETLDKELEKLQLQYKKLELPALDNSSPMDLEAAELGFKSSEENLKEAKASLDNQKNTIKEQKIKEYEEAVKEWEDAEEARDEAIIKAERTVTDAEKKLTEQKKPSDHLETLIDSYHNAVLFQDDELLEDARYNIFDFYYNKEYQQHLFDISDAEEELERAKEKEQNIYDKCNLDMNTWQFYIYDIEIKKRLLEYDAEKKTAAEAVDDAQKKLDRLTRKDVKLDDALASYRQAMEGSLDTQSSHDTLYQLLQDTAKVDETAVTKAAEELERAKEDEAMITADWDKKLNLAQEKKDKLYKDITALGDGSYDYADTLKEYEKAVQEADRAVKEAELQLAKARENENIRDKNNHTQQKSDEIDKKMVLLDINEKKSEINELQDIIKGNGKVFSPVSGTIMKTGLEQGMVLTGQERLIIATGNFELTMTAAKEDMKHFKAGDEVTIKVTDSKKVTSKIEVIKMPDQDGRISFTALLPEGDYVIGGSLEYEVCKNSKSYPECIPIQALREDSNGTYLLLARPIDSVLGKEEQAYRLEVTVLSIDSNMAAIDTQASEEDQVIIGSSKNISEGDRVRVDEME